MNTITLLGRIGQDPEVRTVGETSVTKFTLATSERWKNKQGEKQEKTEWHNIESWGKQGEVIAQYFAKGDPILLTGSLVYDKWEDKDGEIVLSKVIVPLRQEHALTTTATPG